jgi:hypothetical protein
MRGILVLIVLIIVSGYGWNRVLNTVLRILPIGLRKELQMLTARRMRV